MEGFEPPRYLGSLIASVNDGAKSAQTGALAFAAIGLYLLATAFSATDEDLLLDRTLAISQLSAQIPATVSFAMMPILFVAGIPGLLTVHPGVWQKNSQRGDMPTLIGRLLTRRADGPDRRLNIAYHP